VFGFVPDKADSGWWRCPAEDTGSLKDLLCTAIPGRVRALPPSTNHPPLPTIGSTFYLMKRDRRFFEASRSSVLSNTTFDALDGLLSSSNVIYLLHRGFRPALRD
jgi:hypothetical protein